MIGKIRKINDMRSSNNVYIDNYPKELVGKELPILIRGTLDTQGVGNRKQRRSKYGAKRPK